MARVLYPGSFDPVTRGHLDLVRRALPLFESVTVAVAANASKQPIFTVEERLEILRAILPDDPRVQVATFTGLVVDFCAANGFDAILRGIRTVSDFEFEYQMALTNRHLRPEIETVFVMPSLEYSYVSSSLIKEVLLGGGDASSFLPEVVEERLRRRLKEER